MPEGDTIFRAARRMHAALAGERVEALRSAHPKLVRARLEGRTIERVRARGKNLLVDFDDGRILHTHLKMRGSWHLYRPGERWKKPARAATVELVTRPFVAVAFSMPVVDLLRAEHASAQLRELGPDLLDEALPDALFVARLRQVDALPLGVALMRQRVLSGIGNVYKSEVLFLERRDPFAPVATQEEAALEALIARARRLMRRNLVGFPRTTRKRYQGRLWVYGRSGEPCRVCATTVRMRRQGDDGRSTYFCPACQLGPAPGEG